MNAPSSAEIDALDTSAVQCRRCTQCEGEDHHWMEDCDENTGEPIWICKHCDETREYE